MDSKTFGMFGPQGLLSKIETKENHDIPILQSSITESPSNDSEPGPSEGKPFGQLNRPQPQPQLKGDGKYSTPIVLLQDLPPVTAAFSVEKIQRKIFSLLEPSDLLQCRLVSKSWLLMATNEKLLESNKDAIKIDHFLHMKYPPYVRVKNCERKLEDVTDFLDGLGSHPLLYSAALNLEMTIAPTDFLMFFDRYGYVVNSLKVTFEAKRDRIDFELKKEEKKKNGKYFVYDMGSLLEFLTKLLIEQLPNLESLFIQFESTAKFAGEIDPQLLHSFKNRLHFANKQNHCLRIINVCNRTPYEIINALCCLAPNLEKLGVDDLRFWVENQHRLHLLKELILDESLRGWHNEEQFFPALASIEEKPALTKFTIGFDFGRYEPKLWPDISTLVTNILEKSCNSLEELNVSLQYFVPGTVFPQMPKVRMLTFSSCWIQHPGFTLLPQAISIASTFPNLHTVRIHEKRGPRCSQDRRPPTEFADFITFILSTCKNEEVPSVKKIIMNREMDCDVFQQHFPKAVVTKGAIINDVPLKRPILRLRPPPPRRHVSVTFRTPPSPVT